MQWESSDFRS